MKKGFTLVELIGVMVILGLMVLVGVPAMTRTLRNTNDDEYNRALTDLYLATESYIEVNRKNFPILDNAGGDVYISLNELKNAGYLRANITNPKTEKVFDYKNAVRVFRNLDGTLDYEYNNNYYGVDGYTTDGLIVHFDALNNSGIGVYDENAEIWKDLSGNNNDGNVYSATWNSNNLSFNGVNDFAFIENFNNLTEITLEAIIVNDEYQSGEREIIANFNNNGYGLAILDGKLGCQKNINSTWNRKKMDSLNTYGKIYYLSMSFDGSNISFNVDGQNITTSSETVSAPTNSTNVSLGANRISSSSANNYFKGKIYAIRIYNRALGQNEIKHNYEIDKLRFNMN